MPDNKFPIPHNEQERLAALKRYNIIDTLPEEEFNDIAKLVAYICDVPAAHVSFIDEKRQWFKATVGFEAPEVPRETTFCQYTIMDSEMWVIPDARKEPRLIDNPNIYDGFKVRFYAGIPLTTPDGYNIGTICAIDHVVKDINDEQKNALSILAKHVISQLELRIKNIELDKQKEIAELAIYAKDSFLANMSHEIRTPLNAIIGFTDLIAKTPLDTTQQEYIESVQTAGENLMLIINDILDLSKIESGNLIIEAQPFNLKNTLRHTYDLLKVKVPKDIEFNLFLDADMPEMVLGDRGRLNQILTNLAGNAIKFTQEGDITVSVKKITENDHEYTLRFSVKDTGIGISEDKLSTIFDRFTQAEESTTRRFGGTGLGLSIVKQLVELQNGVINVKSTLGRGSEFYFILSFGKTFASPDSAPKAVVDQKPLDKLSVLLCEDNILNQKLAKSVITDFGFDLDIANNGEEGIEMFQAKKYDFILMDLQMPVKDGYQTTEYIRCELKSDIPIIAMTAHSLVGEKQKCFDIGMNGYVPKPFKQAELLNEIERVMKKWPESNFKGIDLSYLLEMSCNDQNFINDMIALFVSKVPVEVETLEKAITTHDYDSVKKIAHNMKSSLPIFKLDKLLKYLLAIEKEAANNRFNDETIKKFSAFKNELTEVVNKLNTY
jgi:signal transduction histidine kinase/DNA-binding response OmpR family regulator